MIGSFVRTFFGLLVGLSLLAGCGTPAAPPVAGNPMSDSAAPPVSKPVRVQIPALEVDSNVIDLGLQPNGEMEVPPDAKDTGWFTESPFPGDVGPSVLAAHVDWKGEDGPFKRLHELKQGDEVIVEGEAGGMTRFVVDRVETHSKDAFPSESVYGDTPGPELRLITCTGRFDPGERSYQDNLIVFARLAT